MIISWRAVLATIQRGLGLGPAPPGSRTLTAMVREALNKPGCPLCHLVGERELRGLETVLYEQVTDPGTHRELVASRGFCFEHGWMLVEASERVYNKHGLATIHMRLMRNFLRAVAQGGTTGARRWLIPKAACPGCQTRQQVLGTFGPELARLYMANPGLASDRPATLCRLHLPIVLDKMPAPAMIDLRGRVQARHEQLLTSETCSTIRAAMFGQAPVHLPSPEWCPACVSAHHNVASSQADACCGPHAWMIMRDYPPETAASPLGRSCSLCRITAQPPADVTVTFNDSESLCLGHLKQAIQTDDQNAEAILRRNVAGLERLADELQRYCESADYQFTGTLTGAQRISWRAGIARFAGETPGVDLHVLKTR